MHIGFRNLLLFLFSYMLISISQTTGQRCYNTGNFTANSTYARNRDLILLSLASNVTVNGGFYNTTIGLDPGKVYGLALCRGDSTSEICAECVNNTVQEIIENCPNQKEVLSWGRDPPCIVRYANRSIFGKLELNPVDAGYNTADITTNLSEFTQIWEGLMDRVVKKASAGTSRLKFGTEEADSDSNYFQKIYALMQCTPDLSQSDCDICLRQNVAEFQRCCHGKQGGYVQRASCIFRWDLYPFYAATASPPSPATIPTPGQNNSTIPTDSGGPGGNATAIIVIIVVSTITIAVVLIALFYVLRRRSQQQKTISKQEIQNDDDESETVESLKFDFSTIKAATNDFSTENMLGQGGFGAVYKGSLSDGQTIAVKRLASNSQQGEVEFKNEVLLVAKLQHRNLVRLLGFCFEGSERLLIYEFVPNLSLDNFIFDPIKRLLLDWEKRYRIIAGIARGILYLHEDSRLRIIHRDLKASNILIDQDMNPKISDFGMARLFERDQTQSNTSRVVGTYGYMAPEYLFHGQFSLKSDIFSFGVLVLEIISGQKNSSFSKGEEAMNLLTYAWESWSKGTGLNIIDHMLRGGSSSEMMRCIHIGLLCVQENIANRPTMASVVLMLTSSSISLPVPTKPAFFMHNTMELYSLESSASNQSKSRLVEYSINEASITELEPR